MASQVPLLTLARLLVLIGGVVLFVGGILQAIDVGGLMDFGTSLARLGSLTGIVVGILVGILTERPSLISDYSPCSKYRNARRIPPREARLLKVRGEHEAFLNE